MLRLITGNGKSTINLQDVLSFYIYFSQVEIDFVKAMDEPTRDPLDYKNGSIDIGTDTEIISNRRRPYLINGYGNQSKSTLPNSQIPYRYFSIISNINAVLFCRECGRWQLLNSENKRYFMFSILAGIAMAAGVIVVCFTAPKSQGKIFSYFII